jgi:hypothetical protein
MYQSEAQQPLDPEISIENPLEPETGRERLKKIAVQRVSDDKTSIDTTIEAKAQVVRNIFGMLEKRPVRNAEVPSEYVVEKPEEILNNIHADISQLENPTIDVIFRVLTNSAVEVQHIETWLQKNTDEVNSLVLRKTSLETESSELSAQLTEEEQKNFFIKLFRRSRRRAVSAKLSETSGNISQINTLLTQWQSRGGKIEASLHHLTGKQQELALNAVEQLFQSVLEGHNQLKDGLASSWVKQVLNEDLITREISPELDKLQEKGEITSEDADEYIELIKAQLSEGGQSNWNDSDEKRAAINERRSRLEKLYKKTKFGSLKSVGHRVSIGSSEVPDGYYDRICDFLLRESAKEQVEQLHDSLCDSLSPDLQEKIDLIAKRIIYPYFDWRYPGEHSENILELSKLPIDEFSRLNGLKRLKVVKSFAEQSGVITKEVFSRVEKIIIQRLFEEQLFSGGSESWEGTAAAGKMGDLGNPEALPLMLRHIEVYGSGHTNNAVVYAMEQLLKDSDPTELQQVLDSLPKSKKILLKILADENSYMNRFSRINSRYFTCNLLQNGDLTVVREQLTKILGKGGESDEEQLRTFYLANTIDSPEVLEPLLRLRSEVEQIIIDSKLGTWTQSADKLLAALVNPRNGESTAFPKRMVQEGLGVSEEETLAVLDKILESKSFQKSGFEREAFLDGLVLLNSKENGKVVLETLLSAYRGARNDPARMRRVFQYLSTLDGLGEYDFATPDQAKVSGVSQEITDLQKQYSQSQDKIERKKIRDKIDRLEDALQNLAGLKGIEDIMKHKVTETACRRLELPQEYRDKIDNNLEELLKSGLLEIVPSLAGKYEGSGETEVINLLRTITAHIIEGDFKTWRYSHERSEAQLVGLTEKQKEFWKGMLEPVIIDIEPDEDEKVRRADELKATQEIIRNAKEHIVESKPDFVFSTERVQALTSIISGLTERIKSATSEDEKREYTLEKRFLQAEASLIAGVLEIENATPQSLTRERIITQARELSEKIADLNIPLAGLDIEQIAKIFTVGDIKSVTAYESDDALMLLKVGVEPQETCQSWRRGAFNECLLAYVADSNKKVLNVADNEGRIVARSIIKLTSQRDQNDYDSKTQRATLLVEKPYSLLPNSEVYKAFVRVLLTKAQGLGASVTFSQGFDEAIMQIFEEEARAVGYGMKECELDVFIPHSLNKYEYSDTLGGKISWFDTYKQLAAVTYEKS